MRRFYAMLAVVLLAWYYGGQLDSELQLTSIRRRQYAYQHAARWCGERAIRAELEYNELLEQVRTW